MSLFSKRYAGSTWRHRLRGRLFAVGWILSAGCIIWAFVGNEPEGSISTWACGMVALLITGFMTQPPSRKQSYVERVAQGGVEQTNCWKCDYDLRASTERCPECGERIYSPLEPLDYPENFKRNRPGWGWRLEAYICRRLLARSVPPPKIWGDDPIRRTVAEVAVGND